MKATDVLKEEHEAVLYVLSILEKICEMIDDGKTFEQNHIGQIIEFLKTFVDKCHHGKEEDLLFPELEKVGIKKDNGPIGVMLFEHDAGRAYVKQLSESFEKYKNGQLNYSVGMIEAARKYIALLIQHIDKENNILYNMADKHFSEQTHEKLIAGFEKIETERIGIGKHEEFHKMIDELGKVYLND